MNWLRANLLALQLPEPAIEWLGMVFDATQTLDDFADGDEVSRSRLDVLIWDALVGMPANSFFQANCHTLLPVMANCILKWQASDKAEKAKRASPMSFAWRASFYDLILTCVHLVHGPRFAIDNAEKVMQLYGETLEDYNKEFPNA